MSESERNTMLDEGFTSKVRGSDGTARTAGV
jgi:hypothetical protein